MKSFIDTIDCHYHVILSRIISSESRINYIIDHMPPQIKSDTVSKSSKIKHPSKDKWLSTCLVRAQPALKIEKVHHGISALAHSIRSVSAVALAFRKCCMCATVAWCLKTCIAVPKFQKSCKCFFESC